jgi:putative phosphoesterase
VAIRIAVLADTHVNKLEYLPKKIVDTVSTVDLIIHAGEFTDIQLLKELQQLRDVKAVYGNMDSRQLKSVPPMKEIAETNDKRIAITHGSGAPWGIE